MSTKHGVEVVEVSTGPVVVREIAAGIVGIIGTASPYLTTAPNDFPAVNTPVLLTSAADDERLIGKYFPGMPYSLPAALKALREEGAGVVIAVNVADPATVASVTNEAHALNAAGYVQLANRGVTAVVVKNNAADTTYVLNTDYTVDAATGRIYRVSTGAIAAGATIKTSYDYVDVSGLVAADFAGVEADKTGVYALLRSRNLFGFVPKKLVVPEFSSAAAVITALDVVAAKLRAIALIDAPASTDFAEALALRNSGGIWNRVSRRLLACFDPIVNGDGETDPLSVRAAGAWAKVAREKGFWWSPSNQALRGAVSAEVELTYEPDDDQAQVQLLNAAGIATVRTGWGDGIRFFGNHTLAYPSSAGAETFAAVQVLRDVVAESIIAATMPFLDRPLTGALVTDIVQTVQNFLDDLRGRGALLAGSKCSYDPAKNPTNQLSQGRLKLDLVLVPALPCEAITFEEYLDTAAIAAALAA